MDEYTHPAKGRTRRGKEDVERKEEEALRGVVERGERRGLLEEMAVDNVRASLLYRSSAGATGSRWERNRRGHSEI